MPRVRDVCEPVLYGPHTDAELARVSRRAASRPRPAAPRTTRSSRAVADARSGAIDAIATAPINKEAFALAGLPWKGHTDLLAHLTGTPRVAMMFYAEALRVVLATIHVPLADVPRLLTRELVECIDRPHRARAAAVRLSRAAAGARRAQSARRRARRDRPGRRRGARAGGRGVRGAAASTIDGPLPADTIFVRATRGEFDAVIACYHDQGLIPVKLLAFGRAVNVTLGLPIIRTSVDHGTAFDIAGRGHGRSLRAWSRRSGSRRVWRRRGSTRDQDRARRGAEDHRRQPQGAPRLPPARDLRGRAWRCSAPR